MAFFSAAELTDLRAEQIAAFDKTCVVRSYAASVTDAEGGDSPGAITDVETDCRVGNPTAQEREIAARLGQDADVAITLPYGTTVSATTQIIVDDSTYEAITTNATQSYQAGLRVAVKRLT